MIVLFLLINIVFTQNELIETFYKNFTKASYDDYYNYSNTFLSLGLTNLANVSVTEFYYKNNNPEGYIVSFPNSDYFSIFIYIDPCRSSGVQFCCQDMGDCREDNAIIVAGNDLEIAWSTNNFIPICENEFKDICGSFIEIHMPGNPEVIDSYKITQYIINGYQTVFINTYKLCSGRYEFWFVTKMRYYSYINYVKPFYVRYPSCSCEIIRKFNNNFNCI
jgi:hypothetical protein